MPIYQVTGRRINDRPDPDGWMSSGTDLPLSNIDAPDLGTALDIGHQMAGKGDTPLTRTVVQAHRWIADGAEEYRDSTRWWLDGTQVEPVRLTREYARDGRVLNRHPIAAARIADEVRWVTGPLGHLWLQVQLTGIDQWVIASAGPQVPLPKLDQRRRFTNPDDALYFAEQKAGVRITEEQAPPEVTAREVDP